VHRQGIFNVPVKKARSGEKRVSNIFPGQIINRLKKGFSGMMEAMSFVMQNPLGFLHPRPAGGSQSLRPDAGGKIRLNLCNLGVIVPPFALFAVNNSQSSPVKPSQAQSSPVKAHQSKMSPQNPFL